MQIKKIFSCLVVVFMMINCVSGFSAYNETVVSAATGENFSLKGDVLTITDDSNIIDLQVCSSNIFKVNYKPGGEEDEETLVIDPDLEWDTGNIVSSDLESDPAVLKTDDMTIRISKSDLSVSVYDSSNKLLLKQDSITASKTVSFSHNSGENFYGISGYGCGTNANDGSLRNNGKYDVTCASQGWAGGPFVWSSGGYGIIVDSDGGSITTGDTTLSYSGISKQNTEYFVIVGDPETIQKGVSSISGNTPMYPKWALGFTNTQWGWPGSDSVESQFKSVIETYRSKQIPIDNFCFDFDWKFWGCPEMDYGEFKWNSTNFPSASSGALKTWAQSKGVHLSGIIKPRIFTGKDASRTTKQYQEAQDNGYVSSTAQKGSDYCAGKDYVSVDFSTAGARNWWWNLYQDSFDLGLEGFWNDEIDHDNGYGNFGNMNAQRAIYEGQREYTNDGTRVWSINRNFYLGAQRYSYGIWTGDINTGFASMKGQAGKLIASVNLGQSKWGMDTGGFNGGDPSPENYARWIQFSAFTPIFRVHGQDCRSAEQAPNTGRSATPRYPWNFGSTAEASAKKVMQLRYQLIPYIYKYEHDASEGGSGIVKSLMMKYPNDSKVAAMGDEWMFGDNLLVAPILDEGQTTKDIYLPAGTWTDYFTGKTYTGNQTIQYSCDATNWDDIPLFVKQGAIIPTQDYVNYVGEKTIDKIYLDVFPDVKQSSFEYYDDDGTSYGYEKGKYFKQNLVVSRNDDWSGVEFKTSEKEGSYTSDLKYYITKIHVKATGTPTIDGKKATEVGSYDKLVSSSGEGYATGTDTYGDVVYVKIAAGEEKVIDVPCEFAAAPEETATVYAKVASSSATLEYSVDGGDSWDEADSMSASDKLGYLQGSVTYQLKSNTPVYVRYKVGTKYYPSAKGVSLDGSSNEYTIGKDGTVTSGVPAMNNINLYIQGNAGDSIIVQYKDDSNKWSSGIELDPYGTEDGQFYKQLSYSADNDSVYLRYSTDGGETWLPSEDGSKVGSGDYMNNEDGSIVAGNPKWSNYVIIYHKTDGKTYIHWRPLGGSEDSWTKAPGEQMSASEIDGYEKIVLNVGTATGAEVCFNNGSGAWDNNGGSNYTFPMGTNTFNAGKITTGDPNGNTATVLKVSASVTGGTYNSAQTVKLTASDSSATIYYTLDGSKPTTSSEKYKEAITISETTTLKAIAVDSQGNTSAINTQKYIIKDEEIIDPPPVEITVSADKSGGVYTQSQTVKLTASDSSATIYYTLDGSTPTESSAKYKGAITISETTTLKAIAIDADGNKSDVITEKYTINNQSSGGDSQGGDDQDDQPTKLSKVTIKVTPTEVYVGNTIKITATANTDDTSVEYLFGYFDEDDYWHELRGYSSSNTYKWDTTEVGEYTIMVEAKSSNVNLIKSNKCLVSVQKKAGDSDGEETADTNSMVGALAIMLIASGVSLKKVKRKNIA